MLILTPTVFVFSLMIYVGLCGGYKESGWLIVDRPSLQNSANEGCNQLRCLDPWKFSRHRYRGFQNPQREISPLQDPNLFKEFQAEQNNLQDPRIIHESQAIREPLLQDSLLRQSETVHEYQNLQEPLAMKDSQIIDEMDGLFSRDDIDRNLQDALGDSGNSVEDNDFGKRSGLTDYYEAVKAIPEFGKRYSTEKPTDHQVKPVNCSCNHSKKLLDLGALSYPRHVSTLECSSAPCWMDSYTCKEKRRMVWVLKKRERTDKTNEHAPLLPEELRNGYTMRGVSVTVACECSG